MSVIVLLLIVSLSVSAVFLGAFMWSVKNKQFEDEFSPPMRILFDDKPAGQEGKATDSLKTEKTLKSKP